MVPKCLYLSTFKVKNVYLAVGVIAYYVLVACYHFYVFGPELNFVTYNINTRSHPTYVKITNEVPYFLGFSLCTCKWGNLDLA